MNLSSREPTSFCDAKKNEKDREPERRGPRSETKEPTDMGVEQLREDHVARQTGRESTSMVVPGEYLQYPAKKDHSSR